MFLDAKRCLHLEFITGCLLPCALKCLISSRIGQQRPFVEAILEGSMHTQRHALPGNYALILHVLQLLEYVVLAQY